MKAAMQAFAIAPSVADGYRGAFLEGPYRVFDAAWLDDDGLIFETSDQQRALAVEPLIAHAARMSKGMFLKLQAAAEDLDMAAAKGEDAHPDSHEAAETLTAVWRNGNPYAGLSNDKFTG